MVMKYLENERPHFFRTVTIWISNLLVIAVLAVFLTEIVGQQFVMSGSSMKETILDQDKVLVDRVCYQLGAPKRFDIILFESADGTRSVKRIIGLPGETVQIVNGVVYVTKTDGEIIQLDDSFVTNCDPVGDFGPVTVPENSYFTLGDNRNNSIDSRFWKNKFVKREKIIGKVLFRYYPKISAIE